MSNASSSVGMQDQIRRFSHGNVRRFCRLHGAMSKSFLAAAIIRRYIGITGDEIENVENHVNL